MSNENKAHDFAIAYLSNPALTSYHVTEDENGNKQLDVFALYKTVYKEALSAFEQNRLEA